MPLPPLALYIHVPWCVRKCPYCDFNSHEAGAELPEQAYIAALLGDLDRDLPLADDRAISSVFIGGGTPSLLSAQAYETLFAGLRQRLSFTSDVEITLEANPGTVEQGKFRAYRALGMNRLSIGVQSFAADKLRALGRIHNGDDARRAADSAHSAGFKTFNLDLMHGLPQQTVAEAMHDLDTAIALAPTHLSWYQLTLEPNTVFYRQNPTLPDDDTLWEIQELGQQKLAEHGYAQYEVSAYAKPGHGCRHNRNYWEFGDYLALGAGAHGKITHADGSIERYRKTRLPRDYLSAATTGLFTSESHRVTAEDLPFEFMMNALRLRDGVEEGLFAERTGLGIGVVAGTVARLREQGLMLTGERLQCSELGYRYLNRVISEFLG